MPPTKCQASATRQRASYFYYYQNEQINVLFSVPFVNIFFSSFSSRMHRRAKIMEIFLFACFPFARNEGTQRMNVGDNADVSYSMLNFVCGKSSRSTHETLVKHCLLQVGVDLVEHRAPNTSSSLVPAVIHCQRLKCAVVVSSTSMSSCVLPLLLLRQRVFNGNSFNFVRAPFSHMRKYFPAIELFFLYIVDVVVICRNAINFICEFVRCSVAVAAAASVTSSPTKHFMIIYKIREFTYEIREMNAIARRQRRYYPNACRRTDSVMYNSNSQQSKQCTTTLLGQKMLSSCRVVGVGCVCAKYLVNCKVCLF